MSIIVDQWEQNSKILMLEKENKIVKDWTECKKQNTSAKAEQNQIKARHVT